MLRKFLFSTVIFVLCFSNSYAANGLFFEGGIGSRYVNGTINYDSYESDYQSEFELSRDPLNSSSLSNSVTDNTTLGWNSKFVGNYNGMIGFRFSDKLVTSLSAHLVLNKPGYGFRPLFAYPNINTQLGEDIQRSSIKSDVETNWFSQISLRATQNIYVNNSLFIIAGVEYSFLKLEFSNKRYIGVSSSRTQKLYKANTFGFLGGIGYELPLSQKVSLMMSGVYSFSSYKGDELYYKNLDFNIGGLELGYTLRYYLK